MKTVTAHVMVKNEDKYIWFSIMSVIDYVDYMIIFDTGSEDNTIKIINAIINSNDVYKNKITFIRKGNANRNQLANYRQEMLDMTKTDYFLVLDGDEIWWEESIIELIKIMNEKKPYLVAQHYQNCAKDIWHYRNPNRDIFPFLDINEAASIRLYSMSIPGIHCGGYYGIEGYFDKDGKEVQCGKYEIVWQKGKYFHTSYIRRSSKQFLDLKAYSRIKKLFPAYDGKYPKDYKFPEVFYRSYPSIVENPLKKEKISLRTIIYFILDTMHFRRIINYCRKLKIKDGK